MRIQNNIMALNTHRFYTNNNNAVSKSAEKLSSGYKINRAGDDAAGLAISEKMRREIRGLSMASKNAQDGVSMVQTAEGALQEVHSMLQRMSEIAVQAASDSNDDAVDRPSLDAEFQQLIKEIDQIAETTTFNDMNLLDGTFADKKIQVGSNAGVTLDISIESMDSIGLGLSPAAGTPGTPGTAPTVDGAATVQFSGGGDTNTAGVYTIDMSGLSITAPTDGSTGAKAEFSFNGETYTIDVTADMDATALTAAVEAQMGASVQIAGADYDVVNNGTELVLTEHDDGTGTNYSSATDQSLTMTGTGTAGEIAAKGADVTTRTTASAAITTVKAAIRTVSDQRAALGAVQNRLEHKISNLDNTVENVSAAESRIRDVDIAKEMTNFTKNNILSQAATAMLAQANAAPQGVLSLLQ